MTRDDIMTGILVGITLAGVFFGFWFGACMLYVGLGF